MSAKLCNQIGNATAIPPRPQTQVECFLQEIHNDVDLIEKAISAHEDKLAPVMRIQNAVPCDGKEVPEEMLVPVADRLRTYHKRLQQQISRIQYITERTEA